MSEETKRISLEIDATLKGDDLKSKLSEMYENVKKTEQSFASMRQGMSDMPVLGEMLNSQLQATETLASTVGNKILSLMKSEGDMTEETRTRAISNLNNSARELSVLSDMQLGDQVFGARNIKQFSQSVSKSLATALDQILPQITNTIRTKINSPKAGEEKYSKIHSVADMQSQLIKDRDVMNIIRNNTPEGTMKQNAAAIRNYLGIAASRAMGYHRMNEFTQGMFGRNAGAFDSSRRELMDPREYLPEGFRSAYDAHGYVEKETHRPAQKVLSNSVRKAIISELNNNPVLYKAAERAQLIRKSADPNSRYGNYGDSLLIDDIMDAQLDRFRKEAYKQLEVRGAGMGRYELENGIYYDPEDKSPRKRNTIASRFQTGTTRQAIEGLAFLDKLGDKDENFVRKKDVDRKELAGTRMIIQKKPMLDMYQISRAMPFLDDGSGHVTDKTTINESDITRMLRINQRGDRAKAYDMMSTISLDGYDPNNAEHRKILEQIYSKGIWVNRNTGEWQLNRPKDENGKVDSNYLLHKFHAAHRGEDGAVLRMLNADEMRRIARETGARAKELGLEGNYLNMYSSDGVKEFGQLDKDGMFLANDKGKFFDAINKMYSPSRRIENNLQGKKVAVVDLGKMADGAGFASSELIRHSIQARGGSGFKGQLIPFYGKTIGDFLIRAGLAKKTLANGEADPNGAYHYWAKSINGEEMVDLMDADIVTDASLWKNAKRQFRNEKGEWYSADEINRRASALLGETSLSEMVDLDKESEANQLGTQLTSYMIINPKMRKMQLDGFRKRMAELETYEGMKKYVFANPETDEMAAELQKPGNESLLNTQRYRDRVNLYKQSLLHDVSTHKFIDFSEDAGDSFTNVTNSINPLSALLQGNEGGEIPKHILDTARDALNANRKPDQKEYTDEDVKDILLLRRSKGADGKEISNVIDYGTDDDYVAYARSPAAFGAFVYGRNRAKEMSIIENALTQRSADDPIVKQLLSATGTDDPLLHKGGVFLGQEDWKALSGADVDGDRVKRIRGIYADMIRESQENAEMLKAFSSQMDPEGNRRFGEMTLADIKTKTKIPNDVKAFIEDVERLMSEGKEMGIANAVALNPMQMKLDDLAGLNSRFILSARYGNKIYDEYASTFRKNPKQAINHGKEWWASLGIGRNFDAYLDHEDRLFQFDQDQLHAMDAYQEVKDQYERLDSDKSIPAKEFEQKQKELEKQLNAANKDLEKYGVFVSSRGDMLNLRAMGSEDDKAWGLNINMPSVNMDGHLSAMSMAKDAYRLGNVDLGRAESISEAMRYNIQQGNGVYADATDEIKDYASAYLQMFPQFSYGVRGNISDNELQDLRALRSKAIASVDEQIAERRAKEHISDTKAYFKNGESIAKYREKMLGKYYLGDSENAINVVENIDNFGFTTRNLERELRQDALQHFFNDPNVYLVGRNQTMMQQMQETKRIAEDATSQAAQQDIANIEAYDSQPADNSATQKANEEANKAEAEATQAEVEAANARKEAAESRKKAAEAQKATAAKTEQSVQKAEQASEQQARHALDYAEYTVTRTMPWMDTDAVDKHGNPVVGLENIYVTKNGETVKGNLPVSLAPYTPRGQKKRTMEEGRKEQASSEKYGSSSSGADALIGSSISHVMDELGPSAVTNTIYGGGFREMEERAYRSLKEFYTKHEAEMKQLGITFNDADMSSFDPTKSNFSYSGKDAKILDKLNALTPSRLASYFVDDIVRQGRDRNGALFSTDDTRTIISTEGKIYDPIMGNVLNESTMVAGPSGGEKEIGYTLKGIKNSKGEDVVTRFAPDYIVRDGKTGKIVIGDHKSSQHGADKGIIQGSIYAAWLDDLAEEYYKTTDAQRKRDLDPYKIFGQLNDKGEYESNIIGIETRDFFSNITDRREYNQDIRRKESERIRKAQDKKYAEAKENFGKYGLDDIPVVPPSDSNPPSGGNPPAGNNPPPDDDAQRAIADRQREAYYQEYQLLINQFSQLKEAHEGYSSGMRSEMYKDREGTYADNYFRRSIFGKNKVIEENDDLIKQFRELYAKTGKEDYVGVINSLNAQSNEAREAFVSGTRAFAQNRSKRLLENAENFDLRKHDPFFKQREEIENQNNAVKEMESTLDNFILSRFDQSEISRDKNTREVNGILQGGKLVNVRDAELENEDDRNTVSLMKKRLESLKTAADENIQLINDQIERDVDKEIAAMQESSDAATKTHQTSGQQRKNYWDKKRRKIDDSIKDAILSRDAIDKMLEDTETYKEDDPKRKQLERLRDQYNKSIAQESEYLNEGGFDNDRKEDLQKQRVSRLNQLRHYFSGTHESRVAQMASTGMLALKDLDNSGDILNVGNQFYQGMSRMIDDTIGTEKARYTNIVADLSRTGSMSAQERINRSYQSKKLQSLASIRQMDQEAIDLDKMLKTGLDLDGNQIFDPEDNSKTTAGIKEKIENYRDFLKDLSKQAKEALDKTLPDQKDKDITRALEDIKAQSEIQTDKYQYGANQIQRSEAARRRQLNMHLSGSRGAFRQELEWRRSQYDNAVSREESYSLRRKQLDTERTRLQRQLDDDDANGKKLSAEERSGIESQLAAATNEYNTLSDAINNAKQEQMEFGASGQEVTAALTAIGAKVSSVAKQFGTRIWRMAIQETMQFVKAYDAAMTEIQMVTLKTDSEISNIGKGLIDSAVQLKAPIADVTAAATALYRQGLGDEEVQTRLQDVIKFSTTAGVKAADAVKLITVSLNSGLVSSSQEAMDVISALGDSAATTAAEITKGLQKSVYAAKDVGVTYNELVSMLTAITAGTQLGGNIAGTAMQTFMSRFSKIGTNEIIYDENGNETSGSNLALALRSVGIETYEDGKRKRFTDVVSQLAGMWDELSDARKSQISYAFGGTRQYSNLNALLGAFGEKDENGQTTIDKYLEIAEQSNGMTDKKYQNYTESLAASFNTLKSSFDSFVESLTNAGALTGFIDFLSNAISGINELNTALGGLPAILMAVGAALTVLAASNPALLAIAGITAGVAVIGNVANGIAGAAKANSNPYKNYDAAVSKSEVNSSIRNDLISRAEKINNNRDSSGALSTDQASELKRIFMQLNDLNLLDVSTSFTDLTNNANLAAAALAQLKQSAEEENKKEQGSIILGAAIDADNNYANYRDANKKTSISKEDMDASLLALTDPSALLNGEVNGQTLARTLVSMNEQGLLDNISIAFPTAGGSKTYRASDITSENAFDIVTMLTDTGFDEQGNIVFRNQRAADMIANVIKNADDYNFDTAGVKFGTYNKDFISKGMKSALTGDYDKYEDRIINAIVSDLDTSTPSDTAITDYMYSHFLGDQGYLDYDKVRQYMEEKGIIEQGATLKQNLDLFASSDSAFVFSEKGNKITQKQKYDRLYRTLTDKNASIETWLSELGAGTADASFDEYAAEPAFAQALHSILNPDGTFNGDQAALDNFIRVVGSLSNMYSDSSYRSRSKMSSDALSKITAIAGGADYDATLGNSQDEIELQEKELKAILGDELYSAFMNRDFTKLNEMERRASAYADGVNPYTSYENINDIEKILGSNGDVSSYSNTRLEELYGEIPELKEYVSALGLTSKEREERGYSSTWLANTRKKIDDTITQKKLQNNIQTSSYSQQATKAAMAFKGTESESLTEYGNLISQYDSFRDLNSIAARIRSGKYTDSDLATISSKTGVNVNRTNVSTMGSRALSALQLQMQDFSGIINDALTSIIPEDAMRSLVEGMSPDEIISTLQSVGVELNDWVKRAIIDMGVYFKNGKFTPDTEGIKTTLSQTLNSFIESAVANETNANDVFSAITSSITTGSAKSYKGLLNNEAYKDLDIKSFLEKHPETANILRMFDNGMSKEQTLSLLNYAQNPFTTKGSDYYQAYLDYYNAHNTEEGFQQSAVGQQTINALQQLEGWSEFIESGDTKKLSASIAKLDMDKLSDSYKAALQLIDNFATSNQVDRSNMLTTFRATRQSYSNLGHYFDLVDQGLSDSDETYNDIASLLGGSWTGDLVKNNYSDAKAYFESIKSLTDSAYKEFFNSQIKSLGKINETDFANMTVDTDGIVDSLTACGNAAALALANMIKEWQEEIKNAPVKTYNELLTDNLKAQTQNSQYSLSNLAIYLASRGIRSDFNYSDIYINSLLKNGNYKPDQYKALISNSDYLMASTGLTKGYLTSGNFNEYMNSLFNGQTLSRSFTEDILKSLLGNYWKSGTYNDRESMLNTINTMMSNGYDIQTIAGKTGISGMNSLFSYIFKGEGDIENIISNITKELDQREFELSNTNPNTKDARSTLYNQLTSGNYSQEVAAYSAAINNGQRYAKATSALRRLQDENALFSEQDLSNIIDATGLTELTMENVKDNVSNIQDVLTKGINNYISSITSTLQTIFESNSNIKLRENMNTEELHKALSDNVSTWILNMVDDLKMRTDENGSVTFDAPEEQEVSASVSSGISYLMSNSGFMSNRNAIRRISNALVTSGITGKSALDILGTSDTTLTNFLRQNNEPNNILNMQKNGQINAAQALKMLTPYINPYQKLGSDYYKTYLDLLEGGTLDANSPEYKMAYDTLSKVGGFSDYWENRDNEGARNTFIQELEKLDLDKYSDTFTKVSGYLSQFYGTQTDRDALMSSMLSQSRTTSNNRYLLGMLNSNAAGNGTYSAIASVLGGDWTADLVKNNKKVAGDQLENVITNSEEAIKSFFQLILDEINTLENTSLSLDDANISEALRGLDNALANKLADYIDQVNDMELTSPQKTYGETISETYNNMTDSSEYALFGLARSLGNNQVMSSLLSSTNPVSQTILNGWLGSNGYTSDQLNSLISDQGWMAHYQANQGNYLTDAGYNEYLTSRQTGTELSPGYYGELLSSLFGSEWASGEVDMTNAAQTLSTWRDKGFSFEKELESSGLEHIKSALSLVDDALKGTAVSADDVHTVMKELGKDFDSKKASDISKYSKNASEVASIYKNLSAGGASAAKQIAALQTQMTKMSTAREALDRYEKGKASKKDLGILSSYFDIDENTLKKASKDVKKQLAQAMRGRIDAEGVEFDQNISDVLNAEIARIQEQAAANGHTIDVGEFVIDGKFDVSGFAAACSAAGASANSWFVNLINTIGSWGAAFNIAVDSNGTSGKISVNTSGVKSKTLGGGGGGGGGGGKKESAAEKLVNRVKKGEELFNHQLKMIQYQETKHQNAGELTMYGNELQREIDLEKAYLPALQENIKAMKSQLGSVSKGSEDWYKLREALFNAEEQYDEITNTIEENKKKLKENQEAIRQTRIALEDLLTSQIEERIKKQRDMLAGTVDMQSIILDAIKKRYQDEWELVKKDIEKKKEALEQEKSLIDERLNLRKNAADEAEKYEELAELKSQLARVSMDSTRTKDAASLRERIAKIEEEIGWDIADQQAESEKQQIDDQIKGYDEYMRQGDEDLSKFLEDTNNFTQEVTSVLEMSHDELFAWLKNNVTDFKNSLDEVQQQMIDSWEDTYKQMFGITDTYWEQVNAILSNKDTFLNFMRESDEYVNASETEKQSLIYEWEKLYDDYVKARLNGPVGSHSDEGYGDWYGSEYTGADGGGGGGGGGGSGGTTTPVKPADAGKKVFYVYKDGNANGPYTYDDAVKYKNKNGGEVTTNPQALIDDYNAEKLANQNKKPSGNGSAVGSVLNTISTAITTPINAIVNTIGNLFSNKVQKADTGAYTGDQEGLIYVHKKERILNPQQTESFERLTRVAESMNRSNAFDGIVSKMNDWSSNTVVPIDMPSFSPSDFKNSTTTTIGDIIITLNEAKLENDADYEAVAQRVGEKFVKELTKQGLGVSAFGF